MLVESWRRRQPSYRGILSDRPMSVLGEQLGAGAKGYGRSGL